MNLSKILRSRTPEQKIESLNGVIKRVKEEIALLRKENSSLSKTIDETSSYKGPISEKDRSRYISLDVKAFEVNITKLNQLHKRLKELTAERAELEEKLK